MTLKRLLEGNPDVALEKGGNGETLLHLVAIFAFKGNPKETDLVESLIIQRNPLHRTASLRNSALNPFDPRMAYRRKE